MTRQDLAVKILIAAKQMNKPLGDLIEGYVGGRLRKLPENYWGNLPPMMQELVRWAAKTEKTRRKKGEQL